MSIPPHRAAGDLGHIEDHNAIVDVLSGNDDDIASVTTDLADHIAAEDPHGDRVWATEQFAPMEHTHDYPVTSVNGSVGEVTLDAADVGAETPTGAQGRVNDLRQDVELAYTPLEMIGSADGVAPLNSSGVVDTDYLPGFGGGNRVFVSDTEPEDPSEGDLWINTSEQLPEPSPIMPTYFETAYLGDRHPPYAQLPPAGDFEVFDESLFLPLTFTTGSSGRTVIKTTGGLVNNASITSTSAVSYNIAGEGVSIEADFDKGVYQHPRGIQSGSVSRLFVQDEFYFPPDTEVTLTPMWRLSSLPSESDQDQDSDTSVRTAIAPDMTIIRVECW